MSVIPCEQNQELQTKIREYSETLKTQAHQLGNHGLSEQEFYNSGLFRGAIERIRGQFSATMRDKREFVQHVLNHMQDRNFIREWNSSGSENRHDYAITMPSGRIAVIELKGCLDGNNTNIFERPRCLSGHHKRQRSNTMGDVTKLREKGGTRPVPKEVLEEVIRLIEEALEKGGERRPRLAHSSE